MNRLTKICAHCGKEYGPDPRYPGNFKKSKVCGLACMHARKKYSPEKAKAVFWSRVEMEGHNGCWYYTGCRDKWGYGDVNSLGKHIQAHRLSWKLLRGEPGELDVLHRCNNAPCCNPEHLYLGTDKENARDRMEAGTQAWGEKLRNKLTAEQVRAIRAMKGVAVARIVAEPYGVDPGTITAIWRGETWQRLT